MRTRTRSRWTRPGLLLLGLQAGLVAGWALIAPRSFYADFPVLGGSWVDALPPYNEHLIRDVGGLYAGYALLFLWAAAALEAALVRAALVAWLPFAALHFAFHVTHMENLTFTEKVLQTAGLGLVVLLPLLLLFSTGRRRTSTFG